MCETVLLKSLEIQGFKSFPDKTVLSFGQGITAVVGPNGSGKSNISDAVRWVLGEQSSKSLRGSKMEDVIFNGTSSRRAVGFAEVSLTVDNTARKLDFDADDVKVTRRYYRSGESEYLLNGAAVRLKDVQMLFMDTGLGRDGYSIISQGKIGDIVASRSEDRREFFEEAAGISKYRYRKNEAERRLNAAEDNLLRLRDIVQELEERVGPLKTQAEKAKKYLALAGEKKEVEIGLWLRTIEQSRDVLRDLSAKLELARTQYDAAGEAAAEIEARIDGIAEESQRLTVRMDEVRQEARRFEEEAARCDSDAGLLRNDIFHNNETIARLNAQLEQSEEGGEGIQRDIAAREAAIAAKETAAAETEAKRRALEEELAGLTESHDTYAGRIEALSKEASALALRLSDIRVRAVTSESSLNEITLRLSQLAASISLRAEQSGTAEKELSARRDELRLACERVEGLQNTLTGYEMRYRSRAGKLDSAKEEAEKRSLDAGEKARRVRLLEEMERNLEGFAQSVKAVMKQAERGGLTGIHGPVSRLVQAGPAYALAVETALGAAAQNLVCDREEDAKEAIRYLKETKGGRATFLPLTAVKGNILSEKGLENEPGFVGLASSLVEADPQYEGVVRSLLGRTAVAEDLDAAVRLAKKYGYRFRVVSLDGQVVNAGGSMTGGSSVKGAGLLSRRAEIERLQQEARDLSEKARQAKEEVARLSQEAAAAEAALTGARGELSVAGEEKIRLEGEVRRLAEQAEALRKALEEGEAERTALGDRAEACRREAAEAEAEAAEVHREQEQVEAELDSLSGGREELSRRREELSAGIGEMRLQKLAIEKEIEAEHAAITGLHARLADEAGARETLRVQTEELARTNETLGGRAAALTERAGVLRAQAVGRQGRIEELMAERAKGEAEQASLRQQARDKADEREKAGLEAARIEEKCAAASREADDVVRRLYEEYELTRSEAEATVRPAEDVPAATRRLSELKNRIRALGSVNVDAIEEYREVSERYEFLSAQVRDVETSKEELLRLIGDLTVQMREIFIERFRQINYNYGIVFTELFGGGKGELRLTDPDDILGSGIEMHVQPPGKVILNLDALSGGEKALVAIALLFAILKVAPSPFCVLDEIEAALDDVNVDRYAQYLRRMTGNTQFIVITHRRGTMEEADVLYGVTMQERGVSKLLELRASEVEEKLGIQVDKG